MGATLSKCCSANDEAARDESYVRPDRAAVVQLPGSGRGRGMEGARSNPTFQRGSRVRQAEDVPMTVIGMPTVTRSTSLLLRVNDLRTRSTASVSVSYDHASTSGHIHIATVGKVVTGSGTATSDRQPSSPSVLLPPTGIGDAASHHMPSRRTREAVENSHPASSPQIRSLTGRGSGDASSESSFRRVIVPIQESEPESSTSATPSEHTSDVW